MNNYAPYTPKVALMVGAHADDIDFTASGTVAKWAQEGTEVHYLIVTDGSKGSDDPNMTSEQLVQIREQEQRDAAASLGAKEVHFLHYEDAMLEVTLSLKKDIVRAIRQVRPDTVVVMDPTVTYSTMGEMAYINHPDHRAAAQATLDAVFPLARDRLTFPELLQEEGLEPHKVEHVLLVNLRGDHTYYVDITDVFETKVQGLLKHASQFSDPASIRAMLEQWAASAGAKTGTKYAEGFIRLDIR
jgi:LmbE family N-acetylglucosaminyl deacetylase